MAFAAEEIEDGTGLSTAVVYEDTADVLAWLARRRLTGFAAKGTVDQEAIQIKATAALDAEFAPFFLGIKRNGTQALLWPAVGARDINGRTFYETDIPEDYKAAIRMLCELMANDSYLPGSGMAQIKRFKGGDAEVEFQSTSNGSGQLTSIRAVHPDVWRQARRALHGDL